MCIYIHVRLILDLGARHRPFGHCGRGHAQEGRGGWLQLAADDRGAAGLHDGIFCCPRAVRRRDGSVHTLRHPRAGVNTLEGVYLCEEKQVTHINTTRTT